MNDLYLNILSHFALSGEVVSLTPCGQGLINTTVFVTTAHGEYVLQRINTAVFKKPREVMANIVAVTGYLAEKGHPTMSFVKTRTGEYFYEGEEGFWRLSHRIKGQTYDGVTPALLEKGGEAFGSFQKALADFDASTLYETIPDFHNTKARVEALWDAVATCPTERIAAAVEPIEICRRYAAQGSYLMNLLERGDLPLRVVHNDTKVSNVVFGEDYGTVIDLDTVMPGSLLFDFGDAVRSGAATRPESATDFENFAIDKVAYESFLKGFLKGVGGELTETELKLLPFSVFVLSYELGVRFLTDYLLGDVYFRTSYPTENLDRAKGQLAQAQYMFLHMDEYAKLTKQYI